MAKERAKQMTCTARVSACYNSPRQINNNKLFSPRGGAHTSRRVLFIIQFFLFIVDARKVKAFVLFTGPCTQQKYI